MMTETRIETYIPLYRKYRPQAFADMVGQEAIVQTLGNAINLSKVAHAYLFCGPRGTGKTSTARIFAKSLNCEQGPTVAPCQQCASCQGIANGNALDVIEFDAASNNGVADARELIENCQYSSMTGRFKIYIIDEVHMLSSAAFNALLKTLEEPPANVIFIFATTEAHKVLPTIISRCQRFDFNRITTENIINRLRFIAERESIAIDEEALLTIARHARGGLRDAVGLLDQVAVLGRAQQDKVIGRKDVALFIGSLEEDLLLRLGSAIGERRAADLLSELGELLNRGIEPIQLLKDLTVHFRNLLIVSTAGPSVNPEMLSLPPDYFQQLVTQASLFPESEEVPQIIGRLAFVERNIRNSSQPQLWLEVGLIELAYRHEISLVKDLTERVARLEAQLAGQAPMPPRAPQAGAAQPAALPPRAVVAPAVSSQPVIPQSQAIPPVYQEKPPVPTFAKPEPAAPLPAAPQHQVQPVVASKPVPSPATPAAAGSLEALYGQVCALIPSTMFRALLQQQTFALGLEGDLLTIGCVSEIQLPSIKKPDKLVHLQKAVDKAFGRPLRIEVVFEKNRPASSAMPVTAPQLTPQVAAIPAMSAQPASVPAMPSAMNQPGPALNLGGSEPSARSALSSAVAVMEPPPISPVAPSVNIETPSIAAVIPPVSAASPTVESPMSSVMEPATPRPTGQPATDEMPPMDLDEPPLLDDDGPPMDEDELGAASGTAPDGVTSASGMVLGTDHELNEAKKNAMDLLQGRLIE